MKKLNDHADPTKVEGLKNIKKGTDLTHVFSMTITLLCYLDFVVQSILINQCTHWLLYKDIKPLYAAFQIKNYLTCSCGNNYHWFSTCSMKHCMPQDENLSKSLLVLLIIEYGKNKNKTHYRFQNFCMSCIQNHSPRQ